MIVNDERAAEVCKLTPSAAMELLDKGRAGDAKALADWTIYSVYKAMIREGASREDAERHARSLARGVNIEVSFKG